MERVSGQSIFSFKAGDPNECLKAALFASGRCKLEGKALAMGLERGPLNSPGTRIGTCLSFSDAANTVAKPARCVIGARVQKVSVLSMDQGQDICTSKVCNEQV